MVAAAGFEIYDPLASPQQAEDFADAGIVVGTSGSGLTNIVNCPPGATMLEPFSSAHLYGYYYSLSGAAGLRYGYLIGESADERREIGASESDFSLDLDAFASALDWATRAPTLS